MVTKQLSKQGYKPISSVLAKIFMVTKLMEMFMWHQQRSVLAKIFMVTKPQKYGSTFLNVIEY